MPRIRLFSSTPAHGGRKVRRKKNPEPAIARPLPSVGAVLKRARTPYQKNPLSEDEALNLVCDARREEPTHPIEKLLKKFGHELGS